MKSHSKFTIVVLVIISATVHGQLGMLLNKCPRCSMTGKMFDLISLSWDSPPGEVCFTKCLNYCLSNIVGVRLNKCVPTTHLLHHSTSTTSTSAVANPTSTVSTTPLQTSSIPPVASTTTTLSTTPPQTTTLPTIDYRRFYNSRPHYRQFHHQLNQGIRFYRR